MELDNFKCSNEDSILGVWKVINKNAKGIAFLVDGNNILKGVITDGDIRRFLLDKGDLYANVTEVINTNFAYGKSTESYKELRQKISDKIKILPIVNEEFKLVDYYEYNVDLYTPVAVPDLKGKEIDYLIDAFLSTWISSSGEYIRNFEDSFAGFCQSKYGIAVSNGTVALHLALEALNIGAGDEVIVPDLTFAATINAVLHANATPVIVDVDEDSWNISPQEIKKAITPKTKAIIPVHLYGQPCDMDEIMIIAEQNDLFVIEDCAEAHGAEYKNRKVGSFGHINCFSFFGNKVITTGEGGMCLTNSKELSEKMRVLRDHGMSKSRKYWHEMVGYNYRMTNLQASIGLAQLERIEEILKEREALENLYRDKLKELNNIEFQRIFDDRKKITWLVSILFGQDAENIIEELRKVNVDARPFFVPLHKMPIYEKYAFSFENSLKLSKAGINMPTNSNVTEEIIDKIFTVLQNIVK